MNHRVTGRNTKYMNCVNMRLKQVPLLMDLFLSIRMCVFSCGGVSETTPCGPQDCEDKVLRITGPSLCTMRHVKCHATDGSCYGSGDDDIYECHHDACFYVPWFVRYDLSGKLALPCMGMTLFA